MKYYFIVIVKRIKIVFYKKSFQAIKIAFFKIDFIINCTVIETIVLHVQ